MRIYVKDSNMEKEKSVFAPIVIFVYNRVDHVTSVIESLLMNPEAECSDLYIYSDAAKKSTDKEKVISVRNYIASISGFKSVTINYRDENCGLAKNIIDGVTNITNKYGKVIVLEDDIVVSSVFLKYMNDALNKYENDKRVMAISGYSAPSDKDTKRLDETFFVPWFSCWGWATWKDSWELFEKKPKKLLENTSNEMKKRININGYYNMWYQVEANNSGEINTWAIFFFVQIILNDGLVLYGKRDTCRNIGNDGSGTDYGYTSMYDRKYLSTEPIKVLDIPVISNKTAEKAFEHFYKVMPIKHFIERAVRKAKKCKKHIVKFD